jgi:hypothetical protein
MLFKYLDRCTSTCLGLTTKALYLIHFHLRGKVPLNAFCILTPAAINNTSQLLGNDQPSLSSLSSSSSSSSSSSNGEFLMYLLQRWMLKTLLFVWTVPRDVTGTVGALKMVTVARSSRAFEEWRQRGISNAWSKAVEEQLNARSKGSEIAKKKLRDMRRTESGFMHENWEGYPSSSSMGQVRHIVDGKSRFCCRPTSYGHWHRHFHSNLLDAVQEMVVGGITRGYSALGMPGNCGGEG